MSRPILLAGIADDRLVREAMRIQAEQYFAQGDLWFVFCRSDPERALRGLRADSEIGRWDAKAWEGLLWAAQQQGEARLQQELADAVLLAPNTVVESFVSAAVMWLQQRRRCFAFSLAWPLLARIVFAPFGGLVHLCSDLGGSGPFLAGLRIGGHRLGTRLALSALSEGERTGC